MKEFPNFLPCFWLVSNTNSSADSTNCMNYNMRPTSNFIIFEPWNKRPVTVIVQYKFVTISFMSGTNWLVQGIVSSTPKVFISTLDIIFNV